MNAISHYDKVIAEMNKLLFIQQLINQLLLTFTNY